MVSYHIPLPALSTLTEDFASGTSKRDGIQNTFENSVVMSYQMGKFLDREGHCGDSIII